MEMQAMTLGGWVLISAIVFIVSLATEDNLLTAIAWGLGTFLLPVLMPLGFLYLVVTAARDMIKGK